jgi:hypothetical protein
MVDWTANLEIFVAVVVFGGGLVLSVISAVAYARLRELRAALVGAGFLGMAAKGAWLSVVSWQARGGEPWVLPMALFDLWVLTAFYVAMRKR